MVSTSKTQWLRLGDRNSRYFHQKTLVRRRGNRIEALLNDREEWVYDDQEIQNALVSYFKSIFHSNVVQLQRLDSISSYPPISDEDLFQRVASVALEEVRSALFSMGNYKAPGPDGFHPLFFKAKWEVDGASIYDFVQ